MCYHPWQILVKLTGGRPGIFFKFYIKDSLNIYHLHSNHTPGKSWNKKKHHQTLASKLVMNMLCSFCIRIANACKCLILPFPEELLPGEDNILFAAMSCLLYIINVALRCTHPRSQITINCIWCPTFIPIIWNDLRKSSEVFCQKDRFEIFGDVQLMFTFLSSFLMMKKLTGFKKGYLLTRLVFHKGFHEEVLTETPACPEI